MSATMPEPIPPDDEFESDDDAEPSPMEAGQWRPGRGRVFKAFAWMILVGILLCVIAMVAAMIYSAAR
jgi:hypothetical protein